MMLLEIFQTTFNPLFFRQVVKRPTTRAFVYYFIFTTVYSIAVCAVAGWLVAHKWNPTIEVARLSLPPFEVTLSEGHLSTTLPEPLVFSASRFTVLVDTSGKSLDATPYPRAILVGKTKLVIKKDRFETSEYSWDVFPDFRMTSDDFLHWLTANKATVLWSVFTTLALGILPLLWLFLIPPILLAALFLMIPAKVFKTSLQYGQTVSIALYAITLPTLIQTDFLFSGIADGLTFCGIYLIWSVIGVALCRNIERQ